MRVALCYDLLRFCLCSSICVIDSRFRSPISYHFTPQHTIPPWSSTGTIKNWHHPQTSKQRNKPRQGTSKFDSDHRRYDGPLSPVAFLVPLCVSISSGLSYYMTTRYQTKQQSTTYLTYFVNISYEIMFRRLNL